MPQISIPSSREPVVVATRRSPVGKSPRGRLRTTRPDDLGADVLRATLAAIPDLPADAIDDVAIGCATPEGEQGLNVARVIACSAGLPDQASAVTVNRFCASGLQSIAMIAERIMLGAIDGGVAGGVESMSLVAMGGDRVMPNPGLVSERPEVYMDMGLTAERVAQKFEISREDQDAFALQSHQRAVAAIRDGRFDTELVTIDRPECGRFERDEGPREDTNLAALAKLRPVFHARGSVTAGNSSQRSDGAAMTVLMSRERAEALGVTPMARFVGFATAGVAPEIMGIGPIEAIPKVLAQTGLKLEDIDLIELNEAFASQALAVIRHLGLDPERVNVNGGAIALGHPLGCTGAKLSATLLHELKRREGRYGMVTMCVGGGMGAAGIFERL